MVSYANFPEIKEVTFYSSNPQVDEYGNVIPNKPPESVTLPWDQVLRNVGFSFSTGETFFTQSATEIPTDDSKPNTVRLRIINGFYFGSGKYGRLLAIRYLFEDGTVGWISQIDPSGGSQTNATNYAMLFGNWTEGLTYQQITTHEKWRGVPYIGYADDYLDLEITRVIPPIIITLTPPKETILEGESVLFTYKVSDSCDGEMRGTWLVDGVEYPMTGESGTKSFTFPKEGVYAVRLMVENDCDQTASIASIIDVKSKGDTCDLSITPERIGIRLGDTATFDAIHSYVEIGDWTYDTSKMTTVLRENKRLTVRPSAEGKYTITYTVGQCRSQSILFVSKDIINEGDKENPDEPAPPALPNTPPEEEEPESPIKMEDATTFVEHLYKYPNIMKRNSRYRGHRESEKVLNDHQEQIYDIRQLYKDLDNLDVMKYTTTNSWFFGTGNISISMKLEGNVNNPAKTMDIPIDTDVDSIRVLSNNMIQLSGNIEESMVGIYNIKRRMQELDERIAEAERRYRAYENAYE